MLLCLQMRNSLDGGTVIVLVIVGLLTALISSAWQRGTRRSSRRRSLAHMYRVVTEPILNCGVALPDWVEAPVRHLLPLTRSPKPKQEPVPAKRYPSRTRNAAGEPQTRTCTTIHVFCDDETGLGGTALGAGCRP